MDFSGIRSFAKAFKIAVLSFLVYFLLNNAARILVVGIFYGKFEWDLLCYGWVCRTAHYDMPLKAQLANLLIVIIRLGLPVLLFRRRHAWLLLGLAIIDLTAAVALLIHNFDFEGPFIPSLPLHGLSFAWTSQYFIGSAVCSVIYAVAFIRSRKKLFYATDRQRQQAGSLT